ncbi:Cell wall-associated hydrolase, NlpC family [Streptomyces sp. 2231.1]|uniref:C40 family peptidase n=1 Tax=Streptomyces sp. 2231.1 TaxID=1855347 RepID=UPI0008984DE2|nr:C40 family peptidase [Streptomyces sp. 2231.1]SED61258.1 Cell wall-associated hydrolase, NlpC family [Streptomyces sp. 2231.1]
MASHRKPRPGGTRGPGLRGPALATAAFTSVAVLSQTAEAAADDGRPSMEEIEKKIDELYRRADSSPEDEPAARQRAREEEPRQESARRGTRRAKAPEGRVASAAGPDTAAFLLEEFPQDHFAQNRVMNRLASRVRDTAERGRTGRSPRTPDADAAPYDVKAAKAAVQRKLATARDLLSRLPAQKHARPAEPDPTPWGDALPVVPAQAAWEDGLPAASAPATWEDGLPAVPAPAAWEGTGPQTYAAATSSAAPAPSAATVSQQATKAGKAIAFARAQLGRPYVSGASGPGSYDCSGLTQAAWRAAGVILPRAARDQAVAGTPVALADARPGDLVFFHEDSSHVGLYTGDGTMIHAPEPGAYIREEPVHRGGEALVQGVVRPA